MLKWDLFFHDTKNKIRYIDVVHDFENISIKNELKLEEKKNEEIIKKNVVHFNDDYSWIKSNLLNTVCEKIQRYAHFELNKAKKREKNRNRIEWSIFVEPSFPFYWKVQFFWIPNHGNKILANRVISIGMGKAAKFRIHIIKHMRTRNDSLNSLI